MAKTEFKGNFNISKRIKKILIKDCETLDMEQLQHNLKKINPDLWHNLESHKARIQRVCKSVDLLEKNNELSLLLDLFDENEIFKEVADLVIYQSYNAEFGIQLFDIQKSDYLQPEYFNFKNLNENLSKILEKYKIRNIEWSENLTQHHKKMTEKNDFWFETNEEGVLSKIESFIQNY